MWWLQCWALARLLLVETADDTASNCVYYEKHQGKDDANDGARDDAYSCRAVLTDQYVCEHRIEDGTPQATGERLHHIETECGSR